MGTFEIFQNGVFEHFTKDAKCSTSITHRVNVTPLVEWSKKTGSKFYLNFLYVLSRALNSREDYRMAWIWESNQLICYDKINPTQYVFHDDTEAFTKVLEFAFTKNEVYRVTTGCLTENIASEKVMIKCGLIKEAEHIDWEWHDGRMKNRAEYRLLRHEWKGEKGIIKSTKI